MAACRYRAKIDHTEKTILTLFRVEYHTYEQKKMLLRFLKLLLPLLQLTISIIVQFPFLRSLFHRILSRRAVCFLKPISAQTLILFLSKNTADFSLLHTKL